MQPKEVVRVTSRYFVAGLVFHHGVVTRAAPILNKTLGMSREQLVSFLNRKGYSHAVTGNPERTTAVSV